MLPAQQSESTETERDRTAFCPGSVAIRLSGQRPVRFRTLPESERYEQADARRGLRGINDRGRRVHIVLGVLVVAATVDIVRMLIGMPIAVIPSVSMVRPVPVVHAVLL